MECLNHKGTDATGICNQCGAPICDLCTCTLDNYKVCPTCFETACRNNIITLKRNLYLSLFYFALALICYVVGWILFTRINNLGLVFLGLLLMGLPNVVTFFNRGAFGIIATMKMWALICLLEIIFGIIATPIIVIKQIFNCVKLKANAKYWEKNLSECLNMRNS